jgi:hypothetical protein
MFPGRGPAVPVPDQGRPRRTSSSRLWLSLAVGWGLLGAGACGTIFAISLIPGPLPDGRSGPIALYVAAAVLAVLMVPFCAFVPVPLLIAGRNQLRRSPYAGRRWARAWTVVASASLAVEALFLFRLGNVFAGVWLAASWNLPQPSWRALAFSISFLIVSAAMTSVLMSARRSAAVPRAALSSAASGGRTVGPVTEEDS